MLVTVTDERGNALHSTYPRRAKNLVNQGRAHFTGNNSIMLVDSRKTTEDKTMKDMLSAQELLARVDAILSDHSYMTEAFNTIEKLQSDADTTKLKLDAIEGIVKEREKTNQQIVALLEHMAKSTQVDVKFPDMNQ